MNSNVHKYLRELNPLVQEMDQEPLNWFPSSSATRRGLRYRELVALIKGEGYDLEPIPGGIYRARKIRHSAVH